MGFSFNRIWTEFPITDCATNVGWVSDELQLSWHGSHSGLARVKHLWSLYFIQCTSSLELFVFFLFFNNFVCQGDVLTKMYFVRTKKKGPPQCNIISGPLCQVYWLERSTQSQEITKQVVPMCAIESNVMSDRDIVSITSTKKNKNEAREMKMVRVLAPIDRRSDSRRQRKADTCTHEHDKAQRDQVFNTKCRSFAITLGSESDHVQAEHNHTTTGAYFRIWRGYAQKSISVKSPGLGNSPFGERRWWEGKRKPNVRCGAWPSFLPSFSRGFHTLDTANFSAKCCPPQQLFPAGLPLADWSKPRGPGCYVAGVHLRRGGKFGSCSFWLEFLWRLLQGFGGESNIEPLIHACHENGTPWKARNAQFLWS